MPVTESQEKKRLNVKHVAASHAAGVKCRHMSECNGVDNPSDYSAVATDCVRVVDDNAASNVCCDCDSDVSPTVAESVGESMKPLCRICFKNKPDDKHKLVQELKHLQSSDV